MVTATASVENGIKQHLRLLPVLQLLKLIREVLGNKITGYKIFSYSKGNIN